MDRMLWRIQKMLVVVFVVLFVVGLLCPAGIEATSYRQPPRPPTPAPPQPAGEDDDDDCAPAVPAGIHGVVTNWSYQDEPGVVVVLSWAGWSVDTTSDDNGHYRFGGLHEGVGVLNLNLPPGLKATVQDVALKIETGREYEVNLTCYGGEKAPTLPLMPVIQVERKQVMPGETVRYLVTVVNRLGYDLEGVWLTDLIPAGLSEAQAQSNQGGAEIVYDRLVSVEVGRLSQGERLEVAIEARVAPGVSLGTEIENRVSFIYAGGLAAQASASVTVGEAEKPEEQ